MNKTIKVISIVGPTATGKTRLSVEIAKNLNGEIVSADSMQIYKGMTIATAAPTNDEKQGIKHHLMEFLSSDKSFSVADYVVLAHKAIYDIYKADKLPILVGGTGLYVDSLLNNIKFTDNSYDIKVREKYTNLLEQYGVSYLLDKLKEIDIVSYNKLSNEVNAKRIIRALEFYEITGKTITEQNINSKQDSPYNVIKIGLTCKDRELLYNRINERIDIMLENGLLKEAERVLNSDLSETAKKAIGYKELIPYFSGERSLEECIETLKMNTRRYAKRQLTWFRKDNDIKWLYIDEYENFEDLFNKALKIIKKDFENGQTSF